MDWAFKQGLLTERRQMKQIQSDCDLMMEEMDLIVRAREDGAQSVTIEREQAK